MDNMKKTLELAEISPRRIELTGRHELVVELAGERNLVSLLGRDGQVCLAIEITEAGPVLRFEGTNLKLCVGGDLLIEADRLSLHGRTEVALHSGGDIRVHADRDLTSQARVQSIRSELGNVNVKANDDVCINGERVRVNCDEI
jgi:hypothetical protein